MEIKNVKVILKKPFKSYDSSSVEHQYNIALDQFIYENHGCITGWDMTRVTNDAQVLSYECTTNYINDSDINYFNNVWLKNLSSHHHITGELGLGEVYIDFEN